MEKLYKYRSLSDSSFDYTKSAVLNSELYFSHARSFNDPFDCLPVASLEATDIEFKRYLNDLYKRRMPHLSRRDRIASVKSVMKDSSRNHKSSEALDTLQKGLFEIMDFAGVLSLSAARDNVLMWSHYADCHTGICLEFEATDTTPFFGEAQQVMYQENRPAVNLIKDSHESQMSKSLFTKADFWEYEQEWRMVSPERKPGVHRYPPELLTGVILGANISEKNAEHVSEWIHERKSPTKLYKASISNKEFRLKVNAI